MESQEVFEPTAAELRVLSQTELSDIVTGYNVDEWISVMLAADPHSVGMSEGVAAERVFISKQAVKREKQAAQAAERRAQAETLEQVAKRLQTAKSGATFKLMSHLVSVLRTRGVVMTLKGKTVTVQSLVWEKGSGDVLNPVATFTLSKGTVSIRFDGEKQAVKLTPQDAEFVLSVVLPERSRDLMPRKFRDTMRTHRAKNRAIVDRTGEQAVKTEGTHLEDADLITYPLLATVLTTAGRVSRQGQRVGMTASERREADRLRLKAWREAKRAEKQAEQAAELATSMEALKAHAEKLQS